MQDKIQLKWAGVIVVFVIVLGVYMATLTPTVPFWDSGEFIATSFILGIPHPPGTPLYVMVGRLATLVPVATTAIKINFLSALFCALGVCVMFLVTWKLIVRALGRPPTSREKVLILAGAATAAFFCAFSDSYWENAIEAEVYGAACFVQALIVWMALRWADGVKGGKGDAMLLGIVYISALAGMGIHLGIVLAIPGIVLFVLMTNARSILNARFLTFAVVASIVGVSVVLFLMIRAQQNPAINEGAPSTLDALWKQLNREQYGQGSFWYILTHRKAPIGFQLNEMFLRYWKDEFMLFGRGTGILNELGAWIPILLGLTGMVWQAGRDAKGWWLMFVIAATTSLGLVAYLNFSTHEVRERDYFFTHFFQFFTAWIGVAVTAVLFSIDKALSRQPSPGVTARASALPMMLALPGSLAGTPLIHTYWHTHDRSNFYVAHDYASNMLTPVAPHAILFTNGDNDTFPLWYLQEVEKVRTDVRVVNLSLLQTPWYIHQLKDLEPRVAFTWTDAEIDRLEPYYDSPGHIVWVRDRAVPNIVTAARGTRPIYIAVTTSDLMGYEPHLALEGLNYRLHEETGKPLRVDVAKTREALDNRFVWRGLLNADGSRDTTTYRDDNATHLSENYSAAYVQTAFAYRDSAATMPPGRAHDTLMESALAYMEKASVLTPDYAGVVGYYGVLLEDAGQMARAEDHYRAMLRTHPDTPLLYQRLGYLYLRFGRTAEGEKIFREGMDRAHDFRPLFQTYASWLQEQNRYTDMVAVMQRYLQYHPEDTEWAALVRGVQQYLGSASAPPTGAGNGRR